METALLAALVLPFLYALGAVASLLRSIPAVPCLDPLRNDWDTSAPRLSVVVPACNEEATIEAALTSKLEARYPNLEIVVVDDRPTDETGAIVDRLAASDARIRPVHVRTLPAGWLGKLHALERGFEAATGELILFSDADVRFERDLLARAARTLVDRRLDFLTLVPDLRPSAFVVDAALTTMMRLLLTTGRLWRVSDPRSRVAVGAGLFNFVRRDALLRSPGLSQLKMEVADDIAFGQMMKTSGARCGVLSVAQVVVALWIGRPVTSSAVPFVGPALMLFASVRAVVLTHLRGGIVWRGTFYDLASVRAGSRLELTLRG